MIKMMMMMIMIIIIIIIIIIAHVFSIMVAFVEPGSSQEPVIGAPVLKHMCPGLSFTP